MAAFVEYNECHHNYISIGATVLCEKCGVLYEYKESKLRAKSVPKRPVPKSKRGLVVSDKGAKGVMQILSGTYKEAA